MRARRRLPALPVLFASATLILGMASAATGAAQAASAAPRPN